MDFREFKEFLRDSLKYFIIIVAILFINIYVVGLQQVVGPSMEPNLNDGTILLLDKIGYKVTGVKRFDLISFNASDSKYFVKRVIGVPGDVLEMKDNKLYINGELIDEYYLDEEVNTSDFEVPAPIPEGKYFVLGDNRENSTDSRSVGVIDESEIIGKTLFKIWPLF